MAKVIAITWTGENMEYEGTYSRCDEIYNTESDYYNPSKVRIYKTIKLYDDVDNVVAIAQNLSKDYAVDMLNQFREKIGREYADEDEITKANGGYPVLTRKLATAWIAYGITERQGGYWVLR
jgi:hypothetical protein